MRKALLIVLPFSAALILAAGVLEYTDPGRLPWAISRATGIIAFGLLTASVVLGLGMSTRLGQHLVPKAALYELHAFLSVLTLGFVLVHAAALLFDGFVAFNATDILIPFASPYRPFATGFGVVAAWALVAVTVSFWLRPRLPYQAWRGIHYLSFGVWTAGLAHGIAAGSDASNPLVSQLYWTGSAAVGGLLVYRVLKALQARRPLPKTTGGTSTGTDGAHPRLRQRATRDEAA